MLGNKRPCFLFVFSSCSVAGFDFCSFIIVFVVVDRWDEQGVGNGLHLLPHFPHFSSLPLINIPIFYLPSVNGAGVRVITSTGRLMRVILGTI